jgi:hypothetical protein
MDGKSSDLEENNYDSAQEEEEREARLRELYEYPNEPASSEEPDDAQAIGDLHERLGLPRPDARFFDTGKERTKILVDRKMISNMLECDLWSRREQHFTLYSYETVYDLSTRVMFEPDQANLLVSPKFVHRRPLVITKDAIIREICEYFPAAREILNMGVGRLVMAGGAVANSVYHRYRDAAVHAKDADFFFYGISVEEAEKLIITICEWWTSQGSLFVVYRNEHVTTLFMNDIASVRYGETYQLIHRVYKSPDCIIGGFDLSPCALLWDGEHIMFTDLGMFTVISGLFIVDVSRQSTSFEGRISKYTTKAFTPIFIAKSVKDLKDEFPPLPGKKWRNIPLGGHLNIGIYPSDYVGLVQLQGSIFLSSYYSDYDSGQDYNAYKVEITNALCISRGKEKSVVWGGTMEEAFGPKFKLPMVDLEYFTPDTYWATVGRHPEYTDPTAGEKYMMMRWFGQTYWDEIALIGGRTWVQFRLDFLNTHLPPLHKRIKEAKIPIGVVKWLGMHQNPSRQRFTSSIHPIEETIAWYRPQCMRTLTIGLPMNIFLVLHLGWRDPTKTSTLCVIPRDIFRMLMSYIRRAIRHSPMDMVLTNNYK